MSNYQDHDHYHQSVNRANLHCPWQYVSTITLPFTKLLPAPISPLAFLGSSPSSHTKPPKHTVLKERPPDSESVGDLRDPLLWPGLGLLMTLNTLLLASWFPAFRLWARSSCLFVASTAGSGGEGYRHTSEILRVLFQTIAVKQVSQ